MLYIDILASALLISHYIISCDSECNTNRSGPETKAGRIDLYEECNDLMPSFDNIVSTLLDICDDGKIDVAMQTIDGTIYLFRRFGFVIITLDGAKTNKSYVTKFTFSFLPLRPEYGLTITDPRNVRYGLSLFYKNHKFYVYRNRAFQTIVYTSYYDKNIGLNSKPFYYYGDSIMAFYDKRFSTVEMFLRKILVYLDFHTIKFPDYLTHQTKTIPNFFNYVNQIIALPDDSWMVFLTYESHGSFCIIQNISQYNDHNYYPCVERSLEELLSCPDIHFTLTQESWFIKLWERSSLSQDRLLSCVKGMVSGRVAPQSIEHLFSQQNIQMINE